MHTLNDFFVRLSHVLKRDHRYKADAYYFVMASLGRCMEKLEQPRHVSGGELLGAIRCEAEEHFGPMAATVLGHWGVKNSLDFGAIVFNMVREGILTKQETDSLEDFRNEDFLQSLFNVQSGYRLPEEKSVTQ